MSDIQVMRLLKSELPKKQKRGVIMKRIQSFSLSSFTNHSLVGFCNEVESHILAALPADQKELCADFTEKLKSFKDMLAMSEQTFNDAIVAADKEADFAWTAINTLLQLNTRHYDDTICEAANAVMEVFDNIDNPTRLPYAEEYAKLESLLTQLSAIPAETLKLAMVDGWIAELRCRINVFNELRKTKTEVRSEIETGATKAARSALVDAYRDLVDTLNAKLILDKTEAYEKIALHLNELIAANRASIKAKKNKKADAATDGSK